MKKGYKLLLVGFLYLFSILGFAALYACQWHKNTSYFIVNEDINTVTINSIRFFDTIPDNFKSSDTFLTVRQVNLQLSISYDSLNKANAELSQVTNSIDSLDTIGTILNNQLSTSFNANLNSTIQSTDYPFIKIKDSLNRANNDLRKLQNAEDVPANKYNIEVLIAKNNVSLARNDYAQATARVKIYENLQHYYPDSLLKKQASINRESIRIGMVKFKLSEQIEKWKGYIRDIANDFHSRQAKRLNYCDFVYFSTITATTVGYGDILPNNRVIRMEVCLEVLLCLILFAIFFYVLSKPQVK